MLHLVGLLFTNALTAPNLVVGTGSVVAQRAAPLMMARATAVRDDAKKMPKGVPPAIADRVSFATSGIKQANQVEQVEQLWKVFKGVYANEKLAIAAITKNAVPLQPQFSSPTKIKGTYALLVKRFGKKQAADIIQRNPGVLVCTPLALSKESDEDILKAVDLVEFLDENKGTIKAVATATYLAFVVFLAYGIAAKGNPEYGLPLIGQCILGEPGSLYYGACPPL